MFDSMSVEQSLQEESKILADEDIKMVKEFFTLSHVEIKAIIIFIFIMIIITL